LHSEKNDSWRLQGAEHSDPVHFVQMWVVPDGPNRTPGYEQVEIPATTLSGSLTPVASGMAKHDGEAAIRIGNSHAALYASRLGIGESIELPAAPYLHLFVATGSVELEGAGVLASGDAARFTATGGQRVTALSAAEILVWEMHASLTDG
jgi:redox-sensitive bicupin YhaK (pirin superfamily)